MGASNWDGNESILYWLLNNFLTNNVFFVSVLRKQARKLENDIDMKLVAYSKIGTSTMPSTSAADTAPLLNEHVFDSLSMEIEQMLSKVWQSIRSFCEIWKFFNFFTVVCFVADGNK